MSNLPDKCVHIADLLVTGVAVAADPTGIAKAGAAVKTWQVARSVLGNGSEATKSLRGEIETLLRVGLENPSFHMPEDGAVLLPQMAEERFLPSPTDFAACALDTDKLLGLILDRHTEPEHRKHEVVEAFCNWLRPAIDRMTDDSAFVQTLAPQITANIVASLSQIVVQNQDTHAALLDLKAEIADLKARADTDESALHDLRDLAGDMLMPRVHRATLGEMVSWVTNKVEDLQTTVDRLTAQSRDSGSAANSLILIAKMIANRDFDGADAIIDDLLEMENEGELRRRLDFAARLLLEKANVALLRENPQAAFDYLSRAADSFASIDPLEPARRRNGYAKLLFQHGLRYGGTGLVLAARMSRRALADLSESETPELWAGIQNNLGLAFASQSSRQSGAEGAALLDQAVTAYRAALGVFTNKDHPVEWAMTQNNLGTALRDRGSRLGGAKRADLLGQAVTAYRAALRVYSKQDHPAVWSATQNNLGNTLGDQGRCQSGAEGADLLEQAVTAYRAALSVYSNQDHPVQWAGIQINLGTVLADQGSRLSGAEGAGLLDEAVTAYRAALLVYTEQDHPVGWALTQNNLGNALGEQGRRLGGTRGVILLGQSITAFRAALSVRTEHDHPLDWAGTRQNLSVTESILAEMDLRENRQAHLQAALDHAEAALRVFTPEHMPYNHTIATELRDDIRAALNAPPPSA